MFFIIAENTVLCMRSHWDVYSEYYWVFNMVEYTVLDQPGSNGSIDEESIEIV